jgi:hypothetical protein
MFVVAARHMMDMFLFCFSILGHVGCYGAYSPKRWSGQGLTRHVIQYRYKLVPKQYCESEGYAIRTSQPAGFRDGLRLFEYQLSTLQWMLDREHDPVGLNGCAIGRGGFLIT